MMEITLKILIVTSITIAAWYIMPKLEAKKLI